MLGAIAGDIVGSAYEFKNIKRKDFEPLFHPTARFTDDTVCTIAIADTLLSGKDPAKTLQEWCQRYESNGRWGRRFAVWITSDNPQPYGSLGNGAAMRVGPAGLLAISIEEAIANATRVTQITHDHPEGIKAGQAVSVAVFMAREGFSAEHIRNELSKMFGYVLTETVDSIRPSYTFTEASQDSVPQAIVCALEATSFEDALRNAVSIGGDSDTIAAIAGSIAEARFGVPEPIALKTWSYLPQDMQEVLRRLYGSVPIKRN